MIRMIAALITLGTYSSTSFKRFNRVLPIEFTVVVMALFLSVSLSLYAQTAPRERKLPGLFALRILSMAISVPWHGPRRGAPRRGGIGLTRARPGRCRAGQCRRMA